MADTNDYFEIISKKDQSWYFLEVFIVIVEEDLENYRSKDL